MIKTYSIAGGNPGFFRTLYRNIIIAIAAVGGFFLVTLSAAFAMFVAVGLLILGTIVFGVFWLRAKILGRPMMPYSRMQMQFQEVDISSPPDENDDGVVIDAHETPDGWTVDRD